MKPRRHPYSGRPKLIRQALPRFVLLGNIAFNSDLVKYIETMRQEAPNQTIIYFKIPKFLSHEEKHVRVPLEISEVVKILNR
ncbi:hypothetical protein D8792_09270 [Streptococcus cristatus]|uniref:Uncharacterized protein n=1 Tax=Streptococcus cristatus TaxID=45634 RepID=A0A428GXM8_STRCR|nr:hypothetical protein D8792_09270 [Streptococcus cristatus]